MKRMVLKFLSAESGATAIEYGLISAGIALAIVTILHNLGINLVEKLQTLLTKLMAG